jgi:hypothetical protein
MVQEMVAELWLSAPGQTPLQLGAPARIAVASGGGGQLRS